MEGNRRGPITQILPRRPGRVARAALALAAPGLVGLGLGGCASQGPLGVGAVRTDAAARLGCAEARLSEESYGPHTARVVGCGRAITYVCEQTPGPEGAPRSPAMTEAEARSPGTAPTRCSWVAQP